MLLLDDINVLVSYCLCYIRIILFYMHSVILLFNPGVIKFICAYYGLSVLSYYCILLILSLLYLVNVIKLAVKVWLGLMFNSKIYQSRF